MAEIHIEDYISSGVAGLDDIKKGDYDQQIAVCDEAIRLNPDHIKAYENRGCAYHNKGDYDRAIADFNEAIRINPKESLYYRWRGGNYEAKGDYVRAIADFDEAIRLESLEQLEYTDPNSRLKPGWAKTYALRGSTYYNLKNYKRAIADFEKAVEFHPDEETYRDNLALVKKTAFSGKSKWIWRGIRAGIGIIIGLILKALVGWGTIAGWAIFGVLVGIFIRPIWYFIISLIKKD